MVDVPELTKRYLGIELIDDGVSTADTDNRYDEIARNVLPYREKLTKEEDGIVLLMRNQPMF